MSREITNLKVEISRLKDEFKLKDKEIERIESNKNDLNKVIEKICAERDK